MVFPSVTTGLAAALMATLALGQPAPPVTAATAAMQPSSRCGASR